MKTHSCLTGAAVLLFCAVSLFSFSLNAHAESVQQDFSIPMLDAGELPEEWKQDQVFTLADPAPWTLEELKKAVNVQDPRSVAAYWVWSVNRLVDSYDDGMAMMKYLFADIQPFARGYTEGGLSQLAGWTPFFNERLKDPYYSWLPRAYFEGTSADNGFLPPRPLQTCLFYNNTNTETVNAQTFRQLGRLNIIYWVRSSAGGNAVNITLSKFYGSDRWYVTSGDSSSTLFYDQNGAISNETREMTKTVKIDSGTAEEHAAFYGSAG